MHFAIDFRGEVATNFSPPASPQAAVGEPWHDVLTAGAICWSATIAIVTIRFRPSFTSSEARDRVVTWLLRVAGLRIHLAYWAEQEWHHEIFGSGCLAAERFATLVSRYGGGEHGSVRHRQMSHRQVDEVAPFRRCVGLWHERRHDFDLEADGSSLDAVLQGGGTLFRATSDGDYELVRPGRNVIPASRSWMERNAGVRLSAFPVRAYARSLAETFDHVAESGQPRADDVDLVTRWPGHQRQRSGYRRLVLPITSGHQSLFLSALIRDPSISLLE
ncbi:MAG: hypothetical protein JSS20_03425 [Proteobacteria bacterium]|nr:hypothetical protein [Pseudomonadota bacterium]